MKIGLQLYSVRDAAQENYAWMLSKVGKMGYDAVETAGFFGVSAEDFSAMLKKTGMEIWGTHTQLRLLEEDFEGIVAYHKAIGCKNLIFPHIPHGDAEQVATMIERINHYQPLLEKEGITLHYHNHSSEFLPNKDGQIPFDFLVKETKVNFEFDTFWLHNAGLDPVKMMETYRDRVKMVHLKDGFKQDFSNPESKPRGISVGSGEVPVDAIRAKAAELGMLVIVESEDLDPCGLEEVKRCMVYLSK